MSDKKPRDTVDTTVRNLPRELHQRARQRALGEHRTFSALVAEALDAYMNPPSWLIIDEPASPFDGDKGISSLERWSYAGEEWAILEDAAGAVLLGRSSEDGPALLRQCNHGNPLAEEVYPAFQSLMAKHLGRAESSAGRRL